MLKWIFTPISMLVATNFDTNKYKSFWLSSMHVTNATLVEKKLFFEFILVSFQSLNSRSYNFLLHASEVNVSSRIRTHSSSSL